MYLDRSDDRRLHERIHKFLVGQLIHGGDLGRDHGTDQGRHDRHQLPGEGFVNHLNGPELVLAEFIGALEVVDLDLVIAGVLGDGIEVHAPAGQGAQQGIYFALRQNVGSQRSSPAFMFQKNAELNS